jgi:hypothetical protein
MDFLSWLPAISTTSLFAAITWFAREAISARLTRTVQHQFDQKLEGLRSDLRVAEERLKAELRVREAEITALRSGALSALASRQAALDKRRLEAVDQLWAAFNSLGPARGLAASMAVLKFESATKLAERDPNARKLFEIIGSGFDQSKIDHASANAARPFVSPMVWAVYLAYQAVTMHGVMRWHVLKGGLGPQDFMDHKAIEKLVIAALPHYSDYLEKNGSEVYYYVLEALEQKLLNELQTMLQGSEFDKATVAQASEIVRLSNALQATTTQIEQATQSVT